jgi:hypothetical protein
MIRAPEIAARTVDAIRHEVPEADERAVVSALGSFDQLWMALFPSEQTRIVQLLVGRVTVGAGGIAIDLRQDGLTSIIRDMVTPREGKATA